MAQPIGQLKAKPPDRRARRRYIVVAELEYNLLSGHRPGRSGRGRTVNLSSKCVLFESDGPLPLRKQIELWIVWPVNLGDKVGLRLWVAGPIIRIQGNLAAVYVARHEFLTRRL